MHYPKDLYPFDYQKIEIDKHQIHYIDEGKGQVILFSHPPLASSFMYRDFIHILSKEFRCIALDFPGFGLSTNIKGEKYSIVSQSEILKKFIERLSLKDIIALGHDTGGPSIFKVAIEEPNLFRGLILTDTIIFPTQEYPRIHRMLSVVGSGFFQWLNAQTNFLVTLTYRVGIRTRKLSRQERKVYQQIFNTPSKRRRITELLFSLRQNPDFMEIVKKGFQTVLRDKPTLLIYGEQDPVTLMGITERIHQILSNSSLHLIKDEGHFPHEGQPKEMSEIISHWLKNLEEKKKQIDLDNSEEGWVV